MSVLSVLFALPQWLTAPVWNTVLSQLAGVFVLGMIAALLPVLLAGWSKNPCFILCTAFAVFYVYCNALGTLSNRLFYSGDMEGSFQVMLFYPTVVIQSFAGHHRWILLLWAGVAALCSSTVLLLILPIGFLVLMADFPRMNQGFLLQLYRVGRLNWVLGELLHLCMAPA